MIWGAHGAQNPSDGSTRWHDVTERDNGHFSETAGQSQETPVQMGRPQQDSNLRSRLRRPMLYPLSYGGCATSKGTSHNRHADTHALVGAITAREQLPSRE
jgi:hypothetical protein